MIRSAPSPGARPAMSRPIPGEGSVVNDAAARAGAVVGGRARTPADRPRRRSSLADALTHGYRPAMIAIGGSCVAEAIVAVGLRLRQGGSRGSTRHAGALSSRRSPHRGRGSVVVRRGSQLDEQTLLVDRGEPRPESPTTASTAGDSWNLSGPFAPSRPASSLSRREHSLDASLAVCAGDGRASGATSHQSDSRVDSLVVGVGSVNWPPPRIHGLAPPCPRNVGRPADRRGVVAPDGTDTWVDRGIPWARARQTVTTLRTVPQTTSFLWPPPRRQTVLRLSRTSRDLAGTACWATSGLTG